MTREPEEQGLLENIADHPDDDGVRGVYADWLEDHGREVEARYIRLSLSCDDENMPEETVNRLRQELERIRQAATSAVNDALQKLGVKAAEYEGGIVSHIEITAQDLADNAEQIWQVAPAIRGIFLAFPPGQEGFKEQDMAAYQKLADMAQLQKVQSLSFPSSPLKHNPGRATHALLASPHLTRLETLDVHSVTLEHDGVKALCGNAALHGLKELNLAGCKLTDADARLLAGALFRPHTINLGSNRLNIGGIEALAGSAVLSECENLDLMANLIGDEGVVALSASPNAAKLKSLSLELCGVEHAGVEALVASPHIRHLRELNMGGNPITDASLHLLATAPSCQQLEELTLRSLDHELVSDRGVRQLLQRGRLRRLEKLELTENQFGDETIERVQRKLAANLQSAAR